MVRTGNIGNGAATARERSGHGSRPGARDMRVRQHAISLQSYNDPSVRSGTHRLPGVRDCGPANPANSSGRLAAKLLVAPASFLQKRGPRSRFPLRESVERIANLTESFRGHDPLEFAIPPQFDQVGAQRKKHSGQ
jgi:hypothetical protein